MRRCVRQVRRETTLGRSPTSVIRLAARLASDSLPDSGGSAVAVVVGRGQGSAGLMDAFHRLGFQCVNLSRLGVGVEQEYRREALLDWRSFPADVSVVAVAVSADHCVISSDLIREKSRGGSGTQHLVVVDLGLPPSVDPAVGALDSVTLFNMEDLMRHIQLHAEKRESDVHAAARIVDRAVVAFDREARQLTVEAWLATTRIAIEEVRARVVDRWFDKRASTAPPTRDEIDRLTRSLLNKVLHQRMTSVRRELVSGSTTSALAGPGPA